MENTAQTYITKQTRTIQAYNWPENNKYVVLLECTACFEKKGNNNKIIQIVICIFKKKKENKKSSYT